MALRGLSVTRSCPSCQSAAAPPEHSSASLHRWLQQSERQPMRLNCKEIKGLAAPISPADKPSSMGRPMVVAPSADGQARSCAASGGKRVGAGTCSSTAPTLERLLRDCCCSSATLAPARSTKTGGTSSPPGPAVCAPECECAAENACALFARCYWRLVTLDALCCCRAVHAGDQSGRRRLFSLGPCLGMLLCSAHLCAAVSKIF
jgi:hypothetical protein